MHVKHNLQKKKQNEDRFDNVSDPISAVFISISVSWQS